MQLSVMPSIPALVRRVGVLLQNVSGPEVIDSNLHDNRISPPLAGSRHHDVQYLFPPVPTDVCAGFISVGIGGLNNVG